MDRISRCRVAHGRAGTAVTQEFEAYLKCRRLEHGFLRVRCETCHDERLVAFSCKKRGFCGSCGARRMANSAALLVDGIYLAGAHGSPARFRWVTAPTSEDLTQLTHTIAHRVARYLERQGLLVRDAGNSYLTAKGLDTDPESPMSHLRGS